MKLIGPLFPRGWTVAAALAVSMAALVATLSTPADRAITTSDADAKAIGVSRLLVWIDRHGHRSPLPVPVRGYVYPRLSPDGTRIAVDIRDRAHGIWMWDVAAQSLTPFATGRASDISPVWTSDGRCILFGRGRSVAPALVRQAIAGGPAEVLPTRTDSLLLPNSLAPGGDHLVVTASVSTGFDLQAVDLAGNGAPEPLVATSFDELNGEVSPDGRWLAYQSRQSGQFEIRVRRFDRSVADQSPAPSPQPRSVATPSSMVPAPGALPFSPEVWQVSDHGGTRPVWARNGRELFYLTAENQMMAAPISSGEDFQSGTPIELFAGSIYDGLVGRTFDISPDGQRFLVVMELMGTK